MRRVMLLALAVAWLAPSSGTGRTQPSEPFVAVAVWYPTGPRGGAGAVARGDALTALDRARQADDLAAIKAAGFNSIRTIADWASVQPSHGEYRLQRFEALLAAAGAAGLKVIVQIDAAAPPWLSRRYPDAAVITNPRNSAPVSAATGFCQDHPGVRADLGAFIAAAAQAAAAQPSFYAIDVWRNPGVSSTTFAPWCYCAHTLARFREALEQKYRSLDALNASWGRRFRGWPDVDPRPGSDGRVPKGVAAEDWRQFFALKLQQDLKFRADASAPRGPRPVSSHADSSARADRWLMTTAVDHYGMSIPRPAAGGAQMFRELGSLGLSHSAARDRTWWVGGLESGGRLTASEGENSPTGADLRIWSWAALSRGAGGISYDDWPALTGRGPFPGGTRLRTAGEFAGVVGHNSALFSRLRPHPSRIAILLDPFAAPFGLGPQKPEGPAAFHRALFVRNVPVDFIHPDEVLAGLSTRYAVLYAARPSSQQPGVADALQAFVRAGGILVPDPASGSERVPAGVVPEVRIEPGGGLVEARFLESGDALVLIAMNHAPGPRKVTFTFAPDVPEAIWQNLETGAAVSFVQSPHGPTYTRAFAARDVLVLVRGKRLR